MRKKLGELFFKACDIVESDRLFWHPVLVIAMVAATAIMVALAYQLYYRGIPNILQPFVGCNDTCGTLPVR